MSSMTEDTGPLVSVVIPTRNRHLLVVRAVNSVLSQTLAAIEVIVILDGPDEAATKALSQIDDARLRVETLPQRVGGGNARNTGVSIARGRWVAFLDDDDQWLAGKLEAQIQTAKRSRHTYPIIACRVIARSRLGDSVWPRRFPKPEEPVGDYMFCRKSIFGGEGLIATSGIFAGKELLEMAPFATSLERHQDYDWLLRACAVKGAGVEFVPGPEPLAVWNMDDGRRRVSSKTDWRYSLSWIRKSRHLVTPRAYAAFVLTRVSENAAKEGDRKFLLLLREAFTNGRPALIPLLLHMANSLTTKEARCRLAALFTGKRSRGVSTGPKRSAE